MRAKEFLQQYRNADAEISAKLEQIARLRSLAAKTTQTLTSDVVRTSPENKLERIVTKIADMENEVDADIDRLQDVKKQVENVITTVPEPKQRAVLTRRYINGQTWERIAVDLNLSYQWVCELHGRALQKISADLIEVDT